MTQTDKKEVTPENRVIDRFNSITESIVIRDRTIKDWQRYFSVSVEDPDDMVYLRNLLSEIGDKIDVCTDLYIRMRMTAGSISLEEKRMVGDLIETNPTNQRSYAGKEKAAKAESKDLNISKQIADMLVVPWEEMLKNLRNKARMIEAQITSISAEWKNLNRSFIKD